MAWATVDDVTEITGVDVALTPAVLAMANEDVNMHVGITDDATVYSRDEYWLVRAVAWQAVWLLGQPGNEQRVSVNTVSQEGLQATFKDDVAIVLAPRARRCLKNLSWMGPRSTRLGPARPSIEGLAAWKTTESDPPDHMWAPLAGD